MNVLEELRHELATLRRRGRPFTEAWNTATQNALAHTKGWEKSQWRIALEDTEPAWQAAYNQQPAAPSVHAVELIAA